MLLYPAVPFIVTDNKEAHSMGMVKMIGTNRPCRFCITDRKDLHKFSSEMRLQSGAYNVLAMETTSPEVLRINSYHTDIDNVRNNYTDELLIIDVR